MARNIMKKNNVKILVVGEPRCGKTSFIEVFYNRYRLQDYYQDVFATVYPCEYYVLGQPINVKIYEIASGPIELIEQLIQVHTDANGFVLMYAIDDALSYQRVMQRWYPILNMGDMWNRCEPAIVVGTKRDLRNDPLIIQRLANNYQPLVTQQQGESLVQDKIRSYYECSSIEPHNIYEAFFFIVTMGFANLNANEGGYARPSGHERSPNLCENDVKIVVVGEPGCGKTSFIEIFRNNRGLQDNYQEGYSKVYPCVYNFLTEPINVKIYEIVGGPDELVIHSTQVHTDANGFVLMYAIDDPSSYLKLIQKWYPILNMGDMWNHGEPAIVVGTKRDLRNDPEVIQRLANNYQAPVTQQQGESLVHDKITKYFDCSSIEPHSIEQAFCWILSLALLT